MMALILRSKVAKETNLGATSAKSGPNVLKSMLNQRIIMYKTIFDGFPERKMRMLSFKNPKEKFSQNRPKFSKSRKNFLKKFFTPPRGFDYANRREIKSLPLEPL